MQHERGLLRAAIEDAWEWGWQPLDLHRLVGKRLSVTAAAVVAGAIVDASHGYERLGDQVAPRWMAQVRELGTGKRITLRADAPADEALLREVRNASALLCSLPRLPVLEPPPSTWHPDMATVAGPPPDVSESLLSKVRNLLAKAESTQFEAEAEAFTAKAQELMTRHRIDRAVLDAGTEVGDAPAARRLGIDDPYAEPKYLLLAAICEANGAQAVWSKGMGFATAFGFLVELDVIEELFTSLLVQSSAALRREGSKTDAYGRNRTKAFRRTFLVSFAHRIGQRLRETAEATVAASGDADVFLPVLAARDAEVDDAMKEVFPQVRSKAFRPSISDTEGWYAGLAFGDRADLSVGAPVERRSAS